MSHCVRRVTWCLALMLTWSAWGQATAPATSPATQPVPQGGELIVFVQPTGSAVAKDFDENVLPRVRELAASMDVAVKVVDASKGAPEVVRLTPLMVYQNHRGRSVYLGRYNTLDRLKNHIRTALFTSLPLDAASDRRNEPQKRFEAVIVGMPVKVTPLTGRAQNDFVTEDVQAAIASHIPQRSASLLRPSANPPRRSDIGPWNTSDRLFYFDIHPYLSEDNTLSLSLAVFSQFHCHEPVWTSGDQPVSGSYLDRETLLRKATELLLQQWLTQVRSTEHGDGFDPVPWTLPVMSFDDLGLILPPAPVRDAQSHMDVELVQRWAVDIAAQEERPVVSFRFPEPIRGYAGEAKTLTGTLTLGENLAFQGTAGRFDVPVTSVTMGESDLDDYIHSSIVGVKDHPTASFELTALQSDAAGPELGRSLPASLVGTFTLKGQSIPLTVPVTVDAYVGDDGQARLSITGAWSLNLKNPFKITDAPPGPDPASHTLRFDCFIVLKPAP